MKKVTKDLLNEKRNVLGQKFNGALNDCNLNDLVVKSVTFGPRDNDGCPDGQHPIYVRQGGKLVKVGCEDD